jgi:hypothetical protein
MEFWVAMSVPTTAVALTLAARTNVLGGFAAVAENRWTLDWGPYGRRIPTPPAVGKMLYRVGVIPISIFEHNPGTGLYLYLEFSAGTSTGNLDLDYVLALPARRRALGPTGKLTNVDYPKFVNSLDRKRIESGLTTLRLDDQSFGLTRKMIRHSGMEGAALEMDATRQNALTIAQRAGHVVPDDPAPLFPDGEDASSALGVTWQFRVTPRWRLARS